MAPLERTWAHGPPQVTLTRRMTAAPGPEQVQRAAGTVSARYAGPFPTPPISPWHGGCPINPSLSP